MDDSALVLYFAYGSNLNRVDMEARCPGARPYIPARLPGWKLTFRGVADIEPAAGRTVEGALWWLSPGDVRRLDRYEGAPSLYRQQVVEVATERGPRQAMTYVMTERTYLGLPSAWYLGRIEEGLFDWGLPSKGLKRALDETRLALEAIGVRGYRADGRKRMRAILDSDAPARWNRLS